MRIDEEPALAAETPSVGSAASEPASVVAMRQLAVEALARRGVPLRPRRGSLHRYWWPAELPVPDEPPVPSPLARLAEQEAPHRGEEGADEDLPDPRAHLRAGEPGG